MSVEFLDSNVLVYLVDRRSPAKQAIAQQLVHEGSARQSAIISYQVVQETLHVLTRKLKVMVTADDAQDFLHDVLAPLWKIMPSAALYSQALTLQKRYGFSFYDSLIVAAAVEGGCKRLLSEDLQHGQMIGKLRIENPFF